MWASPKGNSNQDNKPTYGMTSPLNITLPKPIDLKKTTELTDILSLYDVIETDEELNHRYVLRIIILS